MSLDEMRQELELRLRGELLRDWCRELAGQNDAVEFEDGWCSGWRTIRFSTHAIDGLVDGWRGQGDCWGLGRLAFYEIVNESDGVSVLLVVSLKGMPAKMRADLERIEAAPDVGYENIDGDALVLGAWRLADGPCSANDAVALLEDAWHESIMLFEQSITLLEGELPLEGAELAVVSNRFERNRAARELCIAANGSACAICGIDFGRFYGPQFTGVIDVHHRVPLSEIRMQYVVDPVHDLVPVCPNCHRILHSKSGGGAYTVEEVRAMIKEAKLR